MAQITDMGGMAYGDKIKTETMAKNVGLSLGPKGEPQAPTPRTQPTTSKPKKLNLGPASDFIVNGPPKGNNPLASLGAPASIMSEEGLAFKDSVTKARDLMENSNIPLVKQMAAEYIRNAAFARSVQRVETE